MGAGDDSGPSEPGAHGRNRWSSARAWAGRPQKAAAGHAPVRVFGDPPLPKGRVRACGRTRLRRPRGRARVSAPVRRELRPAPLRPAPARPAPPPNSTKGSAPRRGHHAPLAFTRRRRRPGDRLCRRPRPGSLRPCPAPGGLAPLTSRTPEARAVHGPLQPALKPARAAWTQWPPWRRSRPPRLSEPRKRDVGVP